MLHRSMYLPVIETAFQEDLGAAGDLTTEAVIPPGASASAVLSTRQDGTAAGLEVAAAAFAYADGRIAFRSLCHDGDEVGAGQVLAELTGPARGILLGERTALNLLGRMSGIATMTRAVVQAVEGTGAAIADTRKTTPGLRALEKHAVRMGGGANHRFSLGDAVMIKDNHIAVAGGIAEAVRAVRASVGHTVKIEVEVDALEQLAVLLEDPVDVVLLDNMDPATLREAVAMVDGKMVTEASGGITLENAREIAETGVDVLSLGWLTHSVAQLDVGLDIDVHQIIT